MLKGKIGRKMISCGLYDYTLRVTGAVVDTVLVGFTSTYTICGYHC